MGSLASNDEVSYSIRQEINRFESVHPSIYAIYDLVDAIDEKTLADSLRQLVVSIEDAFVNSQEWTLSQGVPDIKLGLLGSVRSGKSALVHRYLTGTYLHEESPEGGRFKKEVSLENQSHLLLIRDEGGPPDQQFSHWIDGVIFVFSLENFESYQMVYDYFGRLSAYRNVNSLPIMLVGTQDSNCEPYVRVIDDAHARKLANNLKKCVYYETCAAYGLNVERVFQDACIKILQTRTASLDNRYLRSNILHLPSSSQRSCVNTPLLTNSAISVSTTSASDKNSLSATLASTPNVCLRTSDSNNPVFEPEVIEDTKGDNNELITPNSTPTHLRKNRRKSNLFQKKNEDEKDKKLNGIGSGRIIPLKQGYLYKRSSKPLNKDWRTKKYVTLTGDARLTYHSNIYEYMGNSRAKEIDLSVTTVKIPGVPFRQMCGRITSNGLLRNQLTNDATSGPKDALSARKRHRRVKSNTKNNLPEDCDSEGYEFHLISMDHQWHFEAKTPEDRDDWVMQIENAILTRLQLNESNKRTRAPPPPIHGSGSNPINAASNITGGYSQRDNHNLPVGHSGAGDASETASTDHLVSSIHAVAGNEYCADCGLPDPDWASLNLGTIVCIGCSGIHRQLGTHISRIRSLHLDDWSPESMAVMCAIGNTLANSVWEAAVPVNAGNRKKPDASSPREEKEAWIRAKYDRQEFLPPLPYPDAPLQQQLIDAIARQDTRQVILCLALATPETVNASYSRQDPRSAMHIAATLGNLVYLQLLLWYNGDPAVTDHEGRNSYYYAHCSQKYDCAEFLRRNGCPVQLVPPNYCGFGAVSLNRTVQSTSIMQPIYPPTPLQSSGASAGCVNTTTTIAHSSQPQQHHFSHLLQQHQQAPPPLPLAMSSGSAHRSLGHIVSGPVGQTVVMLQQSTGGLKNVPPSSCLPHSSLILQSINPAVVPRGSSTGQSLRVDGTPGQQFLPVSVGVNQAIGATLPRRHAPPPLTSSSFQQFVIQPEQAVSGTAHRPSSVGLIDQSLSSVIRSRPICSVPSTTSITVPSFSRPTSQPTNSSNGSQPVSKPSMSTAYEVGI